jgi:hypothetical protein
MNMKKGEKQMKGCVKRRTRVRELFYLGGEGGSGRGMMIGWTNKRNGKELMETTHLHFVQRSRMVELYLYSYHYLQKNVCFPLFTVVNLNSSVHPERCVLFTCIYMTY